MMWLPLYQVCCFPDPGDENLLIEPLPSLWVAIIQRMRVLIVLLVLISTACQPLVPATTPRQTRATPTEAVVSPSATMPEVRGTPSAVNDPEHAPLEQTMPDLEVRFHPDGALYVGDRISLEIIAPSGEDWHGRKAQVWLSQQEEVFLGEAGFAPFGIGGRQQATLFWVWDTAGLPPGEHTLRIAIQPQNFSWLERVHLLPAQKLPAPEPWAKWSAQRSECCLVHIITGTPAEADLLKLLDEVDEQAAFIAEKLGATFAQPVEVTFLPRVLGHGGFAGQGVSISYLERNYASGDLTTVLRHEFTHVLDGQLEGEFRPTMLVEGLAVYLSGGHFKPEPLMPRAAALLPPQPGCIPGTQAFSLSFREEDLALCSLGWYIPFVELSDDFYWSQHEIGYLQAGALVEFIVQTWGWEAFERFYRHIQSPPSDNAEGEEAGAQYRAIEAALLNHFGVRMEELETQFVEALQKERLEARWVEDVRLTVTFYDAVRRYQQLLDPSAYFMTAWLPDRKKMQEQGIVADFLRRPGRMENIALESMLTVINLSLRQGYYLQAAHMLEVVQAMLDEIEAEQHSE